MGRHSSDMREQLVAAASTRFHHRGVASSSLADIARDAGVAPGDVFSRFATMDALAGAVVERWCYWLDSYFAQLDSIADSRRRLRTYVERADSEREAYTAFGCPLAALGRDLRGGALANEAARPLATQQRWLAEQFSLAGFDPATADSHAYFVQATLQGSFAMAHAKRDPSVITASVAHLLAWLADVQAVR